VTAHSLGVVTAAGWDTAVIAATAVHAGFQLTVTWLVYPALGDVVRESWAAAHATHSRRIVPLVGLVYLTVVVAVVGGLVIRPDLPHLVAAAASGVVFLLTAGVAAPLHGRLSPERDPRLFGRLLAADRLRSVFALVALAAAIAAGIR
jgi:hypothetical protein